jgi:flavin-binding protein dodecin
MSQFGKFQRDWMAGAYQMKDKKKKKKNGDVVSENSVARVTEIIASSTVSFDDAVAVGIARACKTLQNVTGAWVQDQKVDVADGKIQAYRVNLKVTFILND